jgi:tripartite ATP-independent transporter DctM subunit
MNQQGVASSHAPGTESDGFARLKGLLLNSENFLITLALAAMVIIPLLDMALRPVSLFISGSAYLERHLTLVVCMVGGAIAARENRLLALSTVTTFLKGRLKAAARLFSSSFGAAITSVLCVASVQFVLHQREQGAILAYGIPFWVVEMVLPLGFAVIAVRLLRHSAGTWSGRALAALLAGAVLAAAIWLPLAPASMVVPALAVLLAATILGAPIFVTMGGAALILLWGSGSPIEGMSIDHYDQVVNPSLPSIPLFTLAGYFLAEGGAPRRLVRVFQALVGHFRGGPAIATVLACAFFTSFTGASGVTILALGGLLMPALLAERYSEKNALGLLTGSGSIGLLFPPSLPVIIYAIIAQIEIKEMFLGGMLPGMIMVVAASIWGILQSPKEAVANKRFNWAEGGSALWEAKWELLLPVVAVAALFSGYATAVEASAVTALYAWIVETYIYRDLKIARDLPRVMSECGLLVGAVLLILGVALGFTGYLIQAQVPDQLITWVQSAVHSPLVFLLALNIFLLVVGCLMDIFSAIIVVVPIMLPMGMAYGINPIHLGIIFLANLELGYLTPPVGMNLFLSSYRFNKPMPEVWRSIVPILIVLLGGVLLITYLPFLSTALPQWFNSTP